MAQDFTAIKKSEVLFKEAIEIFFAHNPKYPLWILLVLYLRKIGKLQMVQNFVSENSEDNLIWGWPKGADIEYAAVSFNNTIVDRWKTEKIESQNIIGEISSSPELISISESFRKEKASFSENTLVLFRPQWEPGFLFEVVSRLLQIDDEWLKLFDNALDQVLIRLFAGSKFRGEFMQPVELSLLVSSLLHETTRAFNIYNPCCGVGSYITIDAPYVDYYGEDINPIICSIAKLRILWYQDYAIVKCCNVFDSHNNNYDAMISTPPFQPFKDNDSIASFLIKKCLVDRKPGIFVLPAGFCFSSSSLKRTLVDNDIIYGVILLPEGLFAPFSAISTIILIINPFKDKSQKDNIILLDASTLVDKKNNILSNREIEEAWKKDSEYKISVSNSLVKSKGYSLIPNDYLEYFLDIPQNAKLVSLSRLGSFINCHSDMALENVRTATLSSFDHINILKTFNESEIPFGKVLKNSLIIQQDCVWISGTGTKSVNMHIENGPVYTHRNNVAFVPNTDIILPEYLILELTKDYVQRKLVQHRPSQLGAILKNIKIIVPSLEVQRKAILEYQTSLISKLGIENKDLKIRNADEAQRELETRKHRIGQILGDVIPSFDSLISYIKDTKKSFNKDTIIDDYFKTTFLEELINIQRGLHKSTSLLRHLTDTVKINNITNLDICDFIARNAKELKPSKYDVFWLVELLEHQHPVIKFSEEDLKIVFENIFTNAVKYGFKDSKNKSYKIKVNLRCVKEDNFSYLRIYISNNGSPLPKGMNPQKVFEWGKGEGTGVGGWQLKHIVEGFGGKIDLEELSNDPEGFTLRYVIYIPLIEATYE